MATTEVPPGEPAASTGGRRALFPIIVAAVAAVLIAVLWFLPENLAMRGLPMTATVLLIVPLSLIAIGVWFFWLAGFSGRTRIGGGVIAVLLIAGFFGSLRGVEFSGEMVPTFLFRWDPDRRTLLEQHRAAMAADLTPLTEDDLTIGSLDMAEYRGAARDGVVGGPPLSREWSAQPPERLWRQPVGGGYAAFVVVGPVAITIEQRRDQEAIVAYDTETGYERWIYEYPAFFQEPAGGDGPRATPTVSDGRVYSLGATGELVCLDAFDGRLIWDINVLKANGVENLVWGMSGAPLVHDGLCIVNPGAQEDVPDSRAVWALDAASGEVRWKSGRGKAAYASPMIATMAGQEQILIFDAVGLAGFDLAGGKQLWSHRWWSMNDINAAQPLVLPGDRVFISSDSGGAVLQIAHDSAAADAEDDASGEGQSWQVDEVWSNNRMSCAYANPVYRDGYIYGLNRGILACVDAETGKQIWKSGRYCHGQLLLSDELLVVLSEQGELVLVKATPEYSGELAKLQAVEGKTWNNPTLADGILYARNHIEMAAYDLR